jgi:glyoxylase-like metal-dependent hydrolase (beta-lactamase superfamily II)
MNSLVLRSASIAAVFAAVYAAYVVAEAQESKGHDADKAKKPAFEKPVKVAEGVWFEQHHDIGAYGSNVAWIEFSDHVVVVDAAFPLGAELALKNIKQTTKGKRVRYAIVTHYHADHSFGSGVFAKEGATIVAHESARADYLAKNVAAYDERKAKDKVAAKYAAAPPTLTFSERLVLDDGKRRAEILWLGHAHTRGDVFTWLPAEKIVLTGDACVNGPFNFLGDSDTKSWIDALTKAEALGAETVLPGHGPLGPRDVLGKQKQYFVELRQQIAALVKQGKPVDEVVKAVDVPAWKAWTGQPAMKPDNIKHVFAELTRGPAK